MHLSSSVCAVLGRASHLWSDYNSFSVTFEFSNTDSHYQDDIVWRHELTGLGKKLETGRSSLL